jgi:hypothetical protein
VVFVAAAPASDPDWTELVTVEVLRCWVALVW